VRSNPRAGLDGEMLDPAHPFGCASVNTDAAFQSRFREEGRKRLEGNTSVVARGFTPPLSNPPLGRYATFPLTTPFHVEMAGAGPGLVWISQPCKARLAGMVCCKLRFIQAIRSFSPLRSQLDEVTRINDFLGRENSVLSSYLHRHMVSVHAPALCLYPLD